MFPQEGVSPIYLIVRYAVRLHGHFTTDDLLLSSLAATCSDSATSVCDMMFEMEPDEITLIKRRHARSLRILKQKVNRN